MKTHTTTGMLDLQAYFDRRQSCQLYASARKESLWHSSKLEAEWIVGLLTADRGMGSLENFAPGIEPGTSLLVAPPFAPSVPL